MLKRIVSSALLMLAVVAALSQEGPPPGSRPLGNEPLGAPSLGVAPADACRLVVRLSQPNLQATHRGTPPRDVLVSR